MQEGLRVREEEERELRRLMGEEPESRTPSPEPEPDQEADRPVTPPADEVGDLPRMYGNTDFQQSLLSVYSTIRPSEVGMTSLASVLAASNLGVRILPVGRVQSLSAALTSTSPGTRATSAAADRRKVVKKENEAGTERCKPM